MHKIAVILFAAMIAAAPMTSAYDAQLQAQNVLTPPSL
jgi:hypothetical protein